jgi:hypothetical protein
MNPTNRTPDDLREAFYELSMAQPMPDAETLDALIRIYPHHAEALTAFAIDLTVDALAHGDVSFIPEEDEAVSPAVARAMSAYHNRMFELQRKGTASSADQAASVTVQNPFLGLDRTAIRNLSQSIGANPTFVSKLRDRMIEIGTIPSKLLEVVAKELKVSSQLLVAHLSAQAVVQAQGQHYKADQKPILGMKQSFQDAVRSSGLTDEQQRHLLSL